MLMILARLVRSESFWAVVKVRSPHTGPEVCYIIQMQEQKWFASLKTYRGDPPRAAYQAFIKMTSAGWRQH